MPPQAISSTGDKVTCRFSLGVVDNSRNITARHAMSHIVRSLASVLRCVRVDPKSKAHSQCSESFYKKEVEQEIQCAPSKTPQERMRMMEMLKKFEEENQRSVENGVDSDDEPDEDDLASRFQEIDMNSVSAADLWSKLTPAEQERFRKIMEDPSSDLAQQLLASAELEDERDEPWWDAPAVEPDEARGPPPRQRYGAKPDVMRVPAAMVKPISAGPPLFFNICAVCIAYSFVTRHFSASPLSSLGPEDGDSEEARRLMSKLVPFLTDRRSTTVYTNLSSLTTDIWSRFDPAQINSDLFALLLRDTAYLARPLPVTALPATSAKSPEVVDPTSHPHVNLIRVLSDLNKLFEISSTRKGAAAKPNHVTQKLLFYVAHILSIPSPVLRTLSEELMERSAMYEAKGAENVAMEPWSSQERNPRGKDKAVIEEL